jgi:leucyl aminopeptidase
MAGMWTSDDNLANELQEASQKTGEKLWRMPLEDEYKEQLKSKIADMKNIGTRYAGAITAALFLNNFVQDKTPYAHVDIAGEFVCMLVNFFWKLKCHKLIDTLFLSLSFISGTAWSDKIGATGWGTKLVTEWVCGRGCTEESSSAIVQYGKKS